MIRRFLLRRRTQQALRIAAGGSWIALAALSLVSGRDRPHTGLSGNVEHMLAYALAAFVTRLVLRQIASRWQFAAFSAASALFEVCQFWIRGRSPSFDNWITSSAGALIGVILARSVMHRQSAKGKPTGKS